MKLRESPYLNLCYYVKLFFSVFQRVCKVTVIFSIIFCPASTSFVAICGTSPLCNLNL